MSKKNQQNKEVLEKDFQVEESNELEVIPAEQPAVQEEQPAVIIEEDVLYTLRDNALFIPKYGTILKNPKEPKPLTKEQLEKIFEIGAKNGISKELTIKKHLVRLRVQEEKEIVQVTKLEKYVVDSE